jgi:tetratricopeptide (TPR) repeat protein
MNYLIHLFMQVVTFPYRIFVAPSQGLKTTWSEGRGRAMLLGIPALIISIVAMAAVGYAQYGSMVTLEDSYKSKFDKSGLERSQILDEVAKDVRAQRVQQGVTAQDAKVEIGEELKKRLGEVERKELVYLNKLISINPENAGYRFGLAKISARQGNAEGALAILKSIAPVDSPGYADAHFQLAKEFALKRVRSRMEMLGNVEVALKHVDHGLATEPERRDAKKLKAELLRRKQSEAQAYVIFEELFDEEPSHFRALIDINNKLNRSDRNNLVLGQALEKYNDLLRNNKIVDNDQSWVQTWTGVVSCQQQLKRFPEAEDALTKEIAHYSQKQDGGPRRVFLEQLLSHLYFAWAQDIGGPIEGFVKMSAQEQLNLVDFYKKSYQYNQRNGMVLQGLARLTVSRFPEVATAARTIYDPEKHVDAPAVVLNQLGSQALLSRQYDRAIQYYERAREKEPNNSAVLNNLSYAYLVSEEQNPSRALQLVDEAIRYLPQAQRTPEVLSRYWHTKGTALMQLDRLNEAIGEFERAIQARPNNVEILQSLIQCYKGSDLLPPQTYLDALKQQLEIEAKTGSSSDGEG